ncbi:phage tail assembly chaperone [Pseudomonas aegrilactucae]|uniref:phage tail assembly chaperone n=1 Tax=Pseudomonas aegrilactucae TaxID=2854028 RepID=UPI0020D21A2B|nr:phage tail assembly chaperone [Pseudomonas aegrilactucae]
MTVKYAVFGEDGVLKSRLVKGIHEIPEAAMEVSESLWLRMTQETDGVWRLLADGTVEKTPLPPVATEVVIEAERAWRDGQMHLTQWLVDRHRDEQESTAMTLTPSEFAELQAFRQALRSWPQMPGFPHAQTRPAPPPWLFQQVE